MAFEFKRIGSMLMTRGVNDAVADDRRFADFVIQSLSRFHNGDWGDVCKEDWQANDDSVIHGSRVIGAYVCPRFGLSQKRRTMTVSVKQ